MVKRTFNLVRSIISTGLFIILLVLLSIVIFTKASGGQPNLFGYQLKTVLSGSMEPGIKTGSILAMKEVDDPTAFQKGDVITFLADENIIITHRIIKVLESGKLYITKGDANDGPDSDPVAAENIIGSYTGFTIPYVGYILSFTATKKGAALFLVIPGLLLLIYSGYTIWGVLRNIEQKDQPT